MFATFRRLLRLRSASASVEAAIEQARRQTSAGDYDGAEAVLRAALSLEPQSPDAARSLGKLLLTAARLDEARRLLSGLLARTPADPLARNLFGMVLRNKGEAQAAEAEFREAIRLQPAFPDAYANLGAVLSELGRAAEAEACFRRAVADDPAHAVAWCNLGLVLAEKGRPEEADECFAAALRADPQYFYARLTAAMNTLREVYEDEADIARSRAAYERALSGLRQWVPGDDRQAASAADTVGWVSPFFLPYQGKNDRELQRVYGEFVCGLMARRYPALSAAPAVPPLGDGQRLRLGIVSAFFVEHSVWKNPIRGWLENLDRSRFEVYGYHTGQNHDAATAVARAACSHFVEGLPFEALARKARGDALHAVIFPEIGMDPATVKLAALRLAPVQCNSWGHPTTSGMPTIDYFLSSELMEPPGGEAHYTEALVRLPNLSVHYTPALQPARPLQRKELGLREDTPVFFCAQSLFKYLPQYDALFPRIARRLGECRFLFISAHRSALLTEKFHRRLARAFEREGLEIARHVVMLPRMDGAAFQAVARLSDVFLDSMGWSGCNSALESMGCGLVPVTCPGQLMRGRHTYAFLRMMELDELVAHDLDAYVDLAVKLAADGAWRERLRREIGSRLPRLYGDLACVRGLEEFLYGAVAGARRAAAP